METTSGGIVFCFGSFSEEETERIWKNLDGDEEAVIISSSLSSRRKERRNVQSNSTGTLDTMRGREDVASSASPPASPLSQSPSEVYSIDSGGHLKSNSSIDSIHTVLDGKRIKKLPINVNSIGNSNNNGPSTTADTTVKPVLPQPGTSFQISMNGVYHPRPNGIPAPTSVPIGPTVVSRPPPLFAATNAVAGISMVRPPLPMPYAQMVRPQYSATVAGISGRPIIPNMATAIPPPSIVTLPTAPTIPNTTASPAYTTAGTIIGNFNSNENRSTRSAPALVIDSSSIMPLPNNMFEFSFIEEIPITTTTIATTTTTPSPAPVSASTPTSTPPVVAQTGTPTPFRPYAMAAARGLSTSPPRPPTPNAAASASVRPAPAAVHVHPSWEAPASTTTSATTTMTTTTTEELETTPTIDANSADSSTASLAPPVATPTPTKVFSSYAGATKANVKPAPTKSITTSISTSTDSISSSSPSTNRGPPQTDSSSPSPSLSTPNRTLNYGDAARQTELEFEMKSLQARGLINRGNMCYMNSILQPLLFCSPLYNTLTKFNNLQLTSLKSVPVLETFVQFISEFPEIPAESWAKSSEKFGEAFVPESIYDALRKKRPSINLMGRQEDAEEFLGFLLDSLHEEFLDLAKPRKKSISGKGGEDNGADSNKITNEDWVEVGPKQKKSVTRFTEVQPSAITRIFNGKLRSVVQSAGNKPSVTIQPFQSLQLDISVPDVHNVLDALKNMTNPEILEEYTSSSTQQTVHATKQTTFDKLPAILILHLKRFVYDEVGGVQKLHKFVQYPKELKFTHDLFAEIAEEKSDVHYELFAVTYHHGAAAMNGHYTSDVYHPSHTWLRIDDVDLNIVSEAAVLEQKRDRDAYLLFYRRKDPIPNSNHDPINTIGSKQTTSPTR